MKIIALIIANRFISSREMAEIVGISTTTIEKHISTMKKKNILKRVGPAKHVAFKRDIKSVYKQSVLGVFWVLSQALRYMERFHFLKGST